MQRMRTHWNCTKIRPFACKCVCGNWPGRMGHKQVTGGRRRQDRYKLSLNAAAQRIKCNQNEMHEIFALLHCCRRSCCCCCFAMCFLLVKGTAATSFICRMLPCAIYKRHQCCNNDEAYCRWTDGSMGRLDAPTNGR